MKSRIGVPVNATLVFEDRTNSNNLGQTYRITVQNIVFHYIEKELVRTVELFTQIVSGEGEVVQEQTFHSPQNNPIPVGKVSITLGMVTKHMVLLAVMHPRWLKFYPENQSFPLSSRDVVNQEPPAVETE